MAKLRENPRFCNNEVVGTKKKLENFWFYYKWWVLGGVLLVIFASVMINDIVNKEKYDCAVVLVTHDSLSVEQTAAIDGALDALVADSDGDGSPNVSIISISGYLQENNAYSYGSDMQFTVYMQGDENNVWIIDTFTKEYLEESGVFNDAFTGEAVSLDGLFSETPGLEDTEGYWLVTRHKLESTAQELYDADMAFAAAVSSAEK